MNKRYAFLLLALLASGCSSPDRETQITVGLASETEVPKELDSFTIKVFRERDNDLRFKQDYFPTNGRDFPTTLGVIPADEESFDTPLRIELEGRQGSQTFLRRVAVVSYRRGKNVLLNMPLRMACFQFEGCGAGQTCAGGQCVPTAVDAEALPEFQARSFFPTEGACFDEDKCLAASQVVSVEADCSFAVPAGVELASGNVSIRWAAAPSRILALEAEDAQEGWVRTSLTRGKLSQGACDSHFQKRGPDGKLLVADWAKEVLVSPTCASKRQSVPFCVSKTTAHSGIGAVFASPAKSDGSK
jgi:hypothetical protein